MVFFNAVWHGLVRDASPTCESSELALPPVLAEDASKKHAKQRKPQTAARYRLNSVFFWLLLLLLLLLLVLTFCWWVTVGLPCKSNRRALCKISSYPQGVVGKLSSWPCRSRVPTVFRVFFLHVSRSSSLNKTRRPLQFCLGI